MTAEMKAWFFLVASFVLLLFVCGLAMLGPPDTSDAMECASLALPFAKGWSSKVGGSMDFTGVGELILHAFDDVRKLMASHEQIIHIGQWHRSDHGLVHGSIGLWTKSDAVTYFDGLDHRIHKYAPGGEGVLERLP